ncbi:hypothetical protein TNCV_2331451 [Trichonephila clavipes]|nr:hypothetical protein TNCV_2331451 [Trichonephila clavipes]
MQVSPVPASDEECARLYFTSVRIPERSCVSSINLKCIMVFLLRERKDVLLEVAKELRVEIDITLPKIEFKKRICQSKYYDEESVKCLLEGILAEKRETRESERETREYEERKLIREFELQRLRAQLSNKLNENKLKAGNRINDLANACILSGKRTAEENCESPVRGTNVFPPSGGRGTEKNNLFKIVEGKEFNVYRNSDCEVKMKTGLCEGRVKAVAMGAQWVINPDNIGMALLN